MSATVLVASALSNTSTRLSAVSATKTSPALSRSMPAGPQVLLDDDGCPVRQLPTDVSVGTPKTRSAIASPLPGVAVVVSGVLNSSTRLLPSSATKKLFEPSNESCWGKHRPLALAVQPDVVKAG